MKRKHLMNCSFSSWYPKYKNITIRSRIIPLPKEFVDYLKADSVVLPGEPVTQDRNSDDESETEEWQALDEDPEQETAVAPEFNEIETQIKDSIRDLGGAVFPKLNWSAPRDAKWISFDGTLRCSCPNDVLLLLKSSDAISKELFETFKHCEDGEGEMAEGFQLVLRQWQEIHPGMEFRCFVKDLKLIAICQRDVAGFYEFTATNQENICKDIMAFFCRKIANSDFPDISFVFDVYRHSAGSVQLIDFSPFGDLTDPLLFSWEELASPEFLEDVDGNEFQGTFRFLTSEAGIQPSQHLTNRLPSDLVDLTQGNDINKLVDFLNVSNLIRRPGEESDSD